MGVVGWFKLVWMLGWLELAIPTACTCLFKVRLGVLNKTLSHMLGKLNLPIFLFNVGLLTLINIDSLMFLAKPCPPPYYLEVILMGGMACVVALMMYRGGILKMLFESFSKGPRGFPYVFIIADKVTTLEPIYGSMFDDNGVFVLGEASRFLMVLLPLKLVCILYLP